MSEVLNVLKVKVEQLNGFMGQRKLFQVQVKESIERLHNELVLVDKELIELVAGIQVYNESISLLQSSEKEDAAKNDEVVSPEVVTEGA